MNIIEDINNQTDNPIESDFQKILGYSPKRYHKIQRQIPTQLIKELKNKLTPEIINEKNVKIVLEKAEEKICFSDLSNLRIHDLELISKKVLKSI